MRGARISAAVLVAGMLGCQPAPEIADEGSSLPGTVDSASATPPPSASLASSARAAVPDAAAIVDVRGTIAERAVELRAGYARLHLGALYVVLADRPIACGAKTPKGAQTLALTVPPSSDGRFFTGSTFSAPFDLEPGGTFLTADASMITIVDAQPTPGGSLVFSGVFSGKPSFGEGPVKLAGKASVPICAEPGEQLITVEKPGGDDLTIVSAIASRHANGSIDDIWLFTDVKGTCQNRNKPNRFTFVDLMDVGVRTFEGVTATGLQPIRPGYHAPAPEHFMSGGSADWMGYGEVSWESFDPKPGGKLKGRLAIWSPKGERSGSGTIEATVCP